MFRYLGRALVVLLSLGLISCGGGGGGDFGVVGAIGSVRITANISEVSLNTTGAAPDPAAPYTASITVRVTDKDGKLLSGVANVSIEKGTASGLLYLLGDDGEDGGPVGVRSVDVTHSGIATLYFSATDQAGGVQIVASQVDATTGRTESNTLYLTVGDGDETGGNTTISSLVFSGSFTDAVVRGQYTLGTSEDTPLLDGTYSRLITVLATNADGNPVPAGGRVDFFLVDSPLNGFPETVGSFRVAGSNGDPQEGGFSFMADNGAFRTLGVIPGYRLVLDDFNQTGVRVVDTVPEQEMLTIDPSGPAFPDTADAGPTIPYILGQARYATILGSAFTDFRGVASTWLTYPATRIGQTAIIIACAEDGTVCATLNTCNDEGTDCGPVYLGVSSSTGDGTITVSATELPPNTNSSVQLCTRDADNVPVATVVDYTAIYSGTTTSVEINGDSSKAGSFVTGADGCTNVSIDADGQIGGSQPIPINFTSTTLNATASVTILSPGAGTLLCSFSACVLGSQCSVTARLIDDFGNPVPFTFISSAVTATDFDSTCPTSDPPRDDNPLAAGTVTPASQATDSNGEADFVLSTSGGPGDAVTATFSAVGGSTCQVSVVSTASTACPNL